MRLFPRRDKKEPHAEAKAAIEESRVDMEDTLAISMEVKSIAARLRRMRQDDHFAEAVRTYLVGEG